MDIRITPSRLSGNVRVPPSKSDIHRKCIAAAFSGGARINAGALCDDTRATLGCLSAMGFETGFENGVITVGARDTGIETAVLDCGESGSTARFIIPAAAYFLKSAVITGSGRLPQRPFGELCGALRARGTDISADRLPMTVSGGLHPGEYRLRGDVSSQFLTGLLLALPALGGPSVITLTTALESAPYVEMTLSVLERFGVGVVRDGDSFLVPPASYRPAGELTAEGDWSAAAFWFLARSLGCDVTVSGLDAGSSQGDRRVVGLLEAIRANTSELYADMTDIPDLLPVLSVAAAAAGGRTVFGGAGRLRLKESDRLACMRSNINALGGRARETADGLVIDGTGGLDGGTADGYGDHRIVMAFAIASAAARGDIVIKGAQAAGKSYEGFFEDFAALGGKMGVLADG